MMIWCLIRSRSLFFSLFSLTFELTHVHQIEYMKLVENENKNRRMKTNETNQQTNKWKKWKKCALEKYL